MVTVITSPPTLSLSKDPINWVLASDSVYADAGEGAINYLTFTLNKPVVANTELPLRWNGSVQTFVAKTVPSPNGANFPTGNGSQAYVNSLVSYFQNNAFLSEDFNISVEVKEGNYALVFTAKKKGQKYNMTALQWENGEIGITQYGKDEKRMMNHCIHFRLYLANEFANGYDEIFAENLATDELGKVSIDVSELLHPYLNRTPDIPLWSGFVNMMPRRSIRAYYIRLADGGGSPVQLGALTQLPTKYVALGGSGYARQSRVGTVFYESNKYKALRLGPTTRVVITDAPQWLTFLNVSTPRINVVVKMKVFFTDNTNETVSRMTIDSWASWTKLMIMSGPVQCEVYSIDAAKKVSSYQIWLQVGETIISEIYTYILNSNTYHYRKYFTYLNSLGGFDTLSVWGAQEGTTEFLVKSANRFLPSPYSLGDTEEFQYHVSQKQRFKCAFEYDSRSQFALVRDFVRSPYRYRFFDGQCYPISIISSQLKEPSEDDNLLFGEFEYAYSFSENAELIP